VRIVEARKTRHMGRQNKTVRAVWRELVGEQEMSGAGVAEFCQARGLRVGQFYAWRRRLRERAEGGFVEVAVVAAQPEGGLSRRSRFVQPRRIEGRSRDFEASAIEVRLCGRRSLRVAPGFDSDHLCAVIRVLEAMPVSVGALAWA
jgi:transposase-like protein